MALWVGGRTRPPERRGRPWEQCPHSQGQRIHFQTLFQDLQACGGIAEEAGHPDAIARAGAVAAQYRFFPGRSMGGHRDAERTPHEIAAHHPHAMYIRQRVESLGETAQPILVGNRDRKRNDRP